MNITKNYDNMVNIIEKMNCLDMADSLDNLLRLKLSVNKLLLQIERAEEEMCSGSNAMFYTFANVLSTDEINFCLEKLNKKRTKLSIEREKKEKVDE